MIKTCVSAIVSIAFLTACTSDMEQSNFELATSYFSQQEFEPSPRFTSLFEDQRPVLDIEFIDLGVAGKLVLEQQDGHYSRYLSADLGGVVLQGGLLHSLYGFGEPLVSAELSEPLSLIIAGRAGFANRFHTYVDGEDRPQIRSYRCEISIAGTREVVLQTGTFQTTLMLERCMNSSQSFENLYWVDRSHDEVIQSRQWVGENIGRMVTQVTRAN